MFTSFIIYKIVYSLNFVLLSFDDFISDLSTILYDVVVIYLHELIPVNEYTKLLCPVLAGRKFMIFYYYSLGVELINLGIFTYLYFWFLGLIVDAQNTPVLSEGFHSIKKHRFFKKELKSIGVY